MARSPTRTPSLDGCLAKLRRASEHIDTLEDEIRRQTPLITLREERELSPSGKMLNVRAEIVAVPDFPNRWAAISGDAIHNIRAALDYLVYELIRLERGHYWGGSQFPIATHPAKHTGRVQRETIKKLGCHWAVIQAYQPYQRGDATSLYDMLFLYLNEFSNQDKHRLLVPVANSAKPDMGVFVIRPVRDCQRQTVHMVWVNGRVLEPGADLTREAFVVTGADPQVHVDNDYTPLVSFGEAALAQIAATDVLRMMHSRASHLVSKFESLF